jgi:site-specific recombinase XerD
MDLRAPKLTRCSLKAVAERLRSLLRYLHTIGRVTTDLSGHVIAPMLYAYEGVPSVLNRDQIVAVLENVKKDKTSAGLRDHAILQLLTIYGLRSGEIRHLRIEDIDWRTEAIHVRHNKTRASTFLPLMAAGRRSGARLSAFRAAHDQRQGDLHPHARALSQARQVIQRGSPAAP